MADGWCDNCKKILDTRSSSSLLFRLQVTGKDKENSCAVISQTEVFSDTCSADNRWICQKKLKHVWNPMSWLLIVNVIPIPLPSTPDLCIELSMLPSLPVQLVAQSMNYKTLTDADFQFLCSLNANAHRHRCVILRQVFYRWKQAPAIGALEALCGLCWSLCMGSSADRFRKFYKVLVSTGLPP